MFQPLDKAGSAAAAETVEEVVDLLYKDLTLRDRVVMSQLTEQELDSGVYLVLAKIIRKEFGLYNQNLTLINSCRTYLGTTYDSYEDPAMVIITELWKKVRRVHHLRRVK